MICLNWAEEVNEMMNGPERMLTADEVVKLVGYYSEYVITKTDEGYVIKLDDNARRALISIKLFVEMYLLLQGVQDVSDNEH